jgi:hypothetical protein
MFNSPNSSDNQSWNSTLHWKELTQDHNSKILEIVERSELDLLKLKCYPEYPILPDSEWVNTQHLYVSIPFPKHMIWSESYAFSDLYSNIIVDWDWELLELLVEYDETFMKPPSNWLRILRATEYNDGNWVLSARKFEGYLL